MKRQQVSEREVMQGKENFENRQDNCEMVS